MKRRKTFNKNIFIFSIAALALASVGFSSWIIGQIQGDKTISASVEINGPTSNVFIGDLTYTDPNKDLSLSFGTANEDKNIGIKEITTVVSSNVTSASYDIGFSEETKKTNTVNVSSRDTFGREAKDYNYFAFENGQSADKLSLNLPIDLSNGQIIQGTNYKEIKIDVSNLNISYGSYFNFLNPQDFYDGKLEAFKNEYLNATGTDIATKKEAYLKALTQAENELNSFVKSFNGKKIVIEIKGNYTFKDGTGGKI